ncbi:hypothetical protein CEP54_010039 [Fusarium duplospermum]|uniref:Uncharacterized protein n=1 Tax=Fusarium duplospermum TaxID=1325734 RepID=A0A428PM98_9HYPO|nr:hypothetical protein CEP54_010039 [Fusarium duplospermum]
MASPLDATSICSAFARVAAFITSHSIMQPFPNCWDGFQLDAALLPCCPRTLTQVIIRTLLLAHSLASDFRVLYPASLISYQCEISKSTDKASRTPDPKVLAQHHHSDKLLAWSHPHPLTLTTASGLKLQLPD